MFSRISVFGRVSLFKRNTLADAGQAPAERSAGSGIVAGIGRVGGIGILLWRASTMIFTAKCDRAESWKMAHRFTNGSAAFVMLSMAFVGMIMVYQSTLQLARAVGDTQLVGATFLKILVRVLGPTVMGLLLACRVGAGIAAEIGAMAVTDQLDALRMCAAEPVETLIVPRLRGAVIASLVLVCLGSASAVLAGLATGVAAFSMSPATYWNLELISISDVVQGMLKALSYGIAVPIVSGAFGLAARGGARGVGEATTAAVVGSSFAIVLLDSIISLGSHAMVGQ